MSGRPPPALPPTWAAGSKRFWRAPQFVASVRHSGPGRGCADASRPLKRAAPAANRKSACRRGVNNSTAIDHPRLTQELLQNHVSYKNLYFCTIPDERMCNEEELASCKRHEKRVFSLINNARVCYNAFGEVILCKTLASKKT